MDNGLAADSPPRRINCLQAEARRVAGWTTTALGFTIPIWVVADSILIGVLVLCWAVSGGWRERLRRMTENPVALAALLLFGWLLIGTFWGGGDLEDRALSVKKYATLLLIPLLISLVVDLRDQNRALLALAASFIVTLLLSFASASGFLPGIVKTPITCDWSNPCIFKSTPRIIY
ncbi:MAG: hypothetical protein HC801_04640 [Nitrospira sp.]|nr:hypothetical protein [Nitrospira sp.]